MTTAAEIIQAAFERLSQQSGEPFVMRPEESCWTGQRFFGSVDPTGCPVLTEDDIMAAVRAVARGQ